MIRLFRMWYCKHRIKNAHRDLDYFKADAERCLQNVDIAALRVAHWNTQLLHAKYPISRPETILERIMRAYPGSFTRIGKTR